MLSTERRPSVACVAITYSWAQEIFLPNGAKNAEKSRTKKFRKLFFKIISFIQYSLKFGQTKRPDQQHCLKRGCMLRRKIPCPAKHEIFTTFHIPRANEAKISIPTCCSHTFLLVVHKIAGRIITDGRTGNNA